MADEDLDVAPILAADAATAQKDHEQYLEERKQLVDAAREGIRTFDKAVLTFGSAVFGFSIAFLKDIAPNPAPDTLKWLGAAWLLFSLGLLTILLSFLFSHRSCLFEIKCYTQRMGNPGSEQPRNAWSAATDWCNFLCIAFIFIGLLCWSIFALDNFSHRETPSVNKIQNPKEPAPSQNKVPQSK